MLVLFPLNCFALVKPTTDFYVNDYANIIDSDVEEYIMGRSVDLANKTGAQIVVVTVNNLEGKNLEEYATTLFRNFGIGDKENNNGLYLRECCDEYFTHNLTKVECLELSELFNELADTIY